MSLSIGIIGLPNVGKSTLFNALTNAQNAQAANYPFCTIEPNKATVPVPDQRVDKLSAKISPQKTVYASVDFIDIAGLVRGASKGEGLGNQFLANIRECAAIVHVARCFEDENVTHVDGGVNPPRDVETIETELLLADMQSVEKRLEKMRKTAKGDKEAASAVTHLENLLSWLDAGKLAAAFTLPDNDFFLAAWRELGLLTAKPVIYCANIDETALLGGNAHTEALREIASRKNAGFTHICAKLEEELQSLPENEQKELCLSYGIEESGLAGIIRAGYAVLGLCSYFTAGPDEVRAWTIRKGWKASQAAGVIHTDFERGFIRAEVISYADYMSHANEAACRAAGVLRTEGRDYVVRDGDVIHFLFNV
ncbi:MAG: redox-regulated ATPase YchF [Desulfovibrio sp.]|jgi:GTP-binding protein YchF|nr:redox-regulated ATPase YchF [Desulfovibrio sp.]